MELSNLLLGLHCISDWYGGVWAAGVEACHGGLQQVQVSTKFEEGCSSALWILKLNQQNNGYKLVQVQSLHMPIKKGVVEGNAGW